MKRLKIKSRNNKKIKKDIKQRKKNLHKRKKKYVIIN